MAESRLYPSMLPKRNAAWNILDRRIASLGFVLSSSRIQIKYRRSYAVSTSWLRKVGEMWSTAHFLGGAPLILLLLIRN